MEALFPTAPDGTRDMFGPLVRYLIRPSLPVQSALRAVLPFTVVHAPPAVSPVSPPLVKKIDEEEVVKFIGLHLRTGMNKHDSKGDLAIHHGKKHVEALFEDGLLCLFQLINEFITDGFRVFVFVAADQLELRHLATQKIEETFRFDNVTTVRYPKAMNGGETIERETIEGSNSSLVILRISSPKLQTYSTHPIFKHAPGAVRAAMDFWALALCDAVVRTGSGNGGFSTFSMAAHGFASSFPTSVSSRKPTQPRSTESAGTCQKPRSSQPVLGTSPHTLLKGAAFRSCCEDDAGECFEYKRSLLVQRLCATDSFYPPCESYDLESNGNALRRLPPVIETGVYQDEGGT